MQRASINLKARLENTSRLASRQSKPLDLDALLMFRMQLHKCTELSMYYFTRSILQISYLYFLKGGMISVMSKTNTVSNSNEYY
jgi:hypothetical protein